MSLTEDINGCGVTPGLMRELARRGGAGDVRAVVTTVVRSATKTLHPDVCGGTEIPAYKALLLAADGINRASDDDLLDALKPKARREKPKTAYERGYVAGTIFGDMIAICSLGCHVAGASQDEQFFCLRPLGFKKERLDYALRFMPEGIAYRGGKTELAGSDRIFIPSEDWRLEADLFALGCLKSGAQGFLRTEMFGNSLSPTALSLPGKSVGHSALKRLQIPTGFFAKLEEFYTPKVTVGTMLVMTNRGGEVFAMGNLIQNKKIEEELSSPS